MVPLRLAIGPIVRKLPGWARDAAPDAAWSFALASVLAALSGADRRRSAWLAAGLALAAGFELAQGLRVVPGTLDILDLLGIAIGYGVALLLSGSPNLGTATHARSTN